MYIARKAQNTIPSVTNNHLLNASTALYDTYTHEFQKVKTHFSTPKRSANALAFSVAIE